MEQTLCLDEGIKEFTSSIKRKCKERRLNREEQWPPCKTEKLVRLELVERERMQDSSSIEQRGRNGAKVVKRTPLACADLFKVKSGKKPVRKVLVDGDAGIGKTTLCTALSEDWANEKILQEFDLLLLLPLRQKKVASAGSLSDLLRLLHPDKDVCNCVTKYVEKSKGSILVIADGWDELAKEGHYEESFLYEFLFGDLYCSVSTVVTSRPSASMSLHRLPCIDRFVEVHGFNDDNIEEYIHSEFSGERAKAKSLLEQLEGNPLVKSICSVPLNCAIVCHLWRMHKEVLPATMTKLYTQMILSIILRNIRKFPKYKAIWNISDFHDLPESLQESWWLLCKFAFQTLQKDQLVFSDKELERFFPQGLVLDDNILCFGLLQSAESLSVVGCGRSFHFLHLTFQEYLAALFLVKQEYDSQISNSSSVIPRLITLLPVKLHRMLENIVLRFFLGIVYNFETFQNSIGPNILTMLNDDLNTNQHDFLYRELALCHWAFEAHNDEFVHVVANHCRGDFLRDFNLPLLQPRTQHDFTAVVYVIANTPECTDMKFRFCYCHLHDSHITALTDALANKNGKLQVESLELSHNELTDKGITELFHRASVAFQSLKRLDLGGNRIGGAGINSVITTLANVSEVEFYFEHNLLEVPSLMIFRDALYRHQPSSLTELYLRGSLSSDADANAEFILALGHCHNLRTLNLSENNLHVPGAKALGKVLPQLSLQMLYIVDAMLGDEGMAALTQSLEGTCHIGCLYLNSNDIHAAGVSLLADSICAGKIVVIVSLYLSDNSLCLEGATAVVRLLSGKRFQASSVDLERCRLTTVGGADDTRTVFQESISCVGIREWICNDGIKANHIQNFDVNNISFTGEGIHLLAGFMNMCPLLSSLHCDHCRITSDDLKQLLLLLSQPKLNLATWQLCDNNINDDGVSTLIQQLPMFPSLRYIFVKRNNHISPEMLANLEAVCEERHKNKEERRRQLSYVEFQTQWEVTVNYLYQLAMEHLSTSKLRLKVVKHEADRVRQVSTGCDGDSHSEHARVCMCDSEGTSGNEATEPHKETSGAGFGNQQSIHDPELELTTSELEPHPLYHAAVESQLPEIPEKLSLHGQTEGSSDSEDYFTPPSSPSSDKMKLCSLNEDENKCSCPEVAHERKFEETGLGVEGRTVAGVGMDQSHPMVDTVTTVPQLGDVISALEEVTEPYLLGIQLSIKTHELETFEKNYPRDIKRQKIEVIKYWLRNSVDCSWEALASAVEKMGGHGNLVKKLRDKHQKVL